ncbi:MAG: hypothetical protein IJ272_06435 [Clostridia bacterium]|nr:hypothetical protein [Clostridia bacterium]
MRKLISDVAEIIRDFETLNLIRKNSVHSIMLLNEDRKLILDVTFIVEEHAAEVCSEMLESLKKEHNVSGNISVREEDHFNRKMVASFFE